MPQTLPRARIPAAMGVAPRSDGAPRGELPLVNSGSARSGPLARAPDPRQGGDAASLGRSIRHVLRSDAAILGTGLAVWLAVVVRIAARLPAAPVRMGDTQDYLTLAAHRPPLYGWLLAAYQWATGGGLEHLPLLQFLLVAAGLLLFSLELGRLLRSTLAGAAAVLLAMHQVVIYDAPRLVMSESLFLALVLAGTGLLFRHVRREGGDRGGSLAGAAACFALAAATRTTGTALLLLPLLVALLDRRLRPGAAALRAGQCIAVAGLLLILAAAGNWARHGRFEIGSFAGVALLGKALILLEPADLPALPSGGGAAAAAAAKTVPVAAEARRLIAAQPDLGHRLRAQLQSTEDLRFASFFPAAEAHWPEWRDATWRDRSDLGLDVVGSHTAQDRTAGPGHPRGPAPPAATMRPCGHISSQALPLVEGSRPTETLVPSER